MNHYVKLITRVNNNISNVSGSVICYAMSLTQAQTLSSDSFLSEFNSFNSCHVHRSVLCSCDSHTRAGLVDVSRTVWKGRNTEWKNRNTAPLGKYIIFILAGVLLCHTTLQFQHCPYSHWHTPAILWPDGRIYIFGILGPACVYKVLGHFSYWNPGWFFSTWYL